MSENKPLDKLILELKERAKELNCLYEIQEYLNKPDVTDEELCRGTVKAIPPGFQYPDVCVARVSLFDTVYPAGANFDYPLVLQANIKVQDSIAGQIEVFYTQERPQEDEGPFLKEERKLINTIAERIGLHVLHNQLKAVFDEQKMAQPQQKSEWWVILEMLRHTDPKLMIRLSRKMVNYLCWTGVTEAEPLLEKFSPAYKEMTEETADSNRPYRRQSDMDLLQLSFDIFEVAGKHISEQDILESIQKWTKEDRSGFLPEIIENMGSSLDQISNALERYHHLGPQMLELSPPREKSLTVALIRRLLTDQSGYINIAKNFLSVDVFYKLMQRIIFPRGSHGQLGGKSAGLFLASHILEEASKENDLFKNIKTPKTWYIASDGLLNFMSYNNLEEVIEQKYKDIGQVRQEYPYVVHVFKNSSFSPEVLKGLQMALEDFGEVPLIIRSSSLLEDRVGAVFAGKYKSLFIANKGTKEERLEELTDAIAEVYASTFGPDPIEYRLQNNLIDYYEEMGILIQEVVGNQIGPYFFPAFAGVAFSHNEFRWSHRIKRTDGLVRLVPGLGTRAVDRLSNDYPVLIAPGQPGLRVNVTPEEIIRYSPKFMDVINLDSGTFETIEIDRMLADYGNDYPMISKLVSVIRQDRLLPAKPLGMDFSKEHFVINFEGLISKTDFIKEMLDILNTLLVRYNYPIDIEFAHNGKDFYLLQCRAQSHGHEFKPAEIPLNLPAGRIIFSANKYITNGIVNDITHIVYVDPKEYGEIANHDTLLEVGKAIGRLNNILPKKQFILMGPGRWGSRGDIKLGVSVTYSEINNTAMLIEIARKINDYVPDLSFGTHFFQDLVESNIRYLPLYPDDNGNIFNAEFLEKSHSIFENLLSEMSHLSKVIRVVDVAEVSGGNILKVLMNADKSLAMAILDVHIDSNEDDNKLVEESKSGFSPHSDVHWRWRMRSVETIAAQMDANRFGIESLYLIGSVKNATAGPASDIDLLIHFAGTDKQLIELRAWLEGWSLSLAHQNFLRTGYRTDGLLDVHIITDEDISKRTSFAIKIGAVSDAARLIPMGSDLK